ncbi:MAG: acyl carrier protein [Gammaproteobacteria bacterium]
MSELREKVIDIISDTLKLAQAERKVLESSDPDAKLAAWDSVKHVELIVALEDEFDIDVEAAWIAKLNHLDRIVTYLQERI